MNPTIKPEEMIITDKRTGEKVEPWEINFARRTITILWGYSEARSTILSLPMPLENYKIRMWTGKFDERNMPIYEQIGE
jgi:hypothetical protein|uniref:Uncharacterized protein n=1 Tax=Siphoviridae sp. ctt5z12 TaxID=2823604 RepID=A0A8S5LBV6_9CAUD|nr:MAG TPA: hypothetical protein [Siphoviridae sp. ctt5z12]